MHFINFYFEMKEQLRAVNDLVMTGRLLIKAGRESLYTGVL